MGEWRVSGWRFCGLTRSGLKRWLGVGVALALSAMACGRTSDDGPGASAESGGRSSGGQSSTSGGGPTLGGRSSTGGATQGGDANDGLVCNTSGWCWVDPDLFGDQVTDIHGTPDASTVFAAINRGAVIEQRAGTWKYHDIGDVELTTVHVVADGDVWAGGSDGLFHLSQGKWSLSDSRQVQGITHTGDGNVWALLDWRVHRLDAAGWLDVSPIDPTIDFMFVDLVEGAQDSELWVLADEAFGRYHECVLERFDGSSWTRMPGRSTREYSPPRIVRSDDGVYAYGTAGVFLATEDWRMVAEWRSSGSAAWGAAGGTLFMTDFSGLTRIDASGSRVQVAESLDAVWGNASGDLWLAPASGGVVQLRAEQVLSDSPRTDPLRATVPWDQAPWESVPLRLWAGASAAWGNDWKDVWRSFGMELQHFDGGSWTPLAMSGAAMDIDGSAPDDVWFVQGGSFIIEGNPELWHWDGASLGTVALPATWAGYRLSQVKSFGPDSVFIAGQSEDRARLGRFDGTDWQILLEVPLTPWHEHWGGLDGLGPRDLWAVGEGVIYHFDGTSFTPAFERDDKFSSLAVDDRDVWVLGNTDAYRRSGGTFVPERYAHAPLSQIELTADYVWAHSGHRVLRRAR